MEDVSPSDSVDKSLAGTLMGTLTTIKFDGSHAMHEYITEMTITAARLRSMRMEVSESFLVQFIINSFFLVWSIPNKLQQYK